MSINTQHAQEVIGTEKFLRDIQTQMKLARWDAAGDLIELGLTKTTSNPKLLTLAITCYRNARDEKKMAHIYELARGSKGRGSSGYVTNGLPFIGTEVKNPHKEFIFVSGAPRSGTTSFGRILNFHNEIAMLTERYTPYFGYHPDMFLPKNVYSPGYENHRHAPQIDRLRTKLKHSRWRGDKRPNFAFGASITCENFKGKKLRVFHIHRNIKDVCWSYEGKKKRSLDQWSYKQACFDYNFNNRELLKLLEKRQKDVRFFIVDYFRLHSEVDYALKIFDTLNLETDTDFISKVSAYIDESSKVLCKTRELNLEINQYIEKNVDWNAEAQLHKYPSS